MLKYLYKYIQENRLNLSSSRLENKSFILALSDVELVFYMHNFESYN